jgi:hypothetical protein
VDWAVQAGDAIILFGVLAVNKLASDEPTAEAVEP